MKSNFSMQTLLNKYRIDSINDILPDSSYPVWRKTDVSGRAYRGVASFWGLDRRPICPEQDLSELEWDGNEIFLDAKAEEDVPKMLKKGIVILKKRCLLRFPQ